MQGINRELFPILENKVPMNTCSMGPLATPVRDAITKYIENWDNYAGLGWVIDDGWVQQIEYARNEFAKLINAKPSEIAYHFGVSTSIASILSTLKLQENDEVIFNDQDFPSVPSASMALSPKNIKYKVVPSTDGKISTEDYKRLITDNTKLVASCEVMSNTGSKVDIKELHELTVEHDVPLFVDAYQSAGCLSIDVKKTDVEYLASGCLKYLIGGFGISFLYVRNDIIEKSEPTSIGWMGVDDPFEDLFNKLRTTLHRPKDAKKFQYGTGYPFGAVSAYEGMKLINQIGINKIADHNLEITQYIIDQALDKDIDILTPIEKSMRGGIVNLQVENPKEKVDNLVKNNFIIDLRANGIRVSPHFFNNSEEIDRLFDIIT
jgi:selenocysteine lyase/cysteine desulfurase